MSDPDGLGSLAGGTLHLVSTGANLGVFSGAVGTYTFTLGWGGTIPNSVLTFPASGGSIELEARFLDTASAMATRRITLPVSCNGIAACTGTCVDLNTSTQNCGRCGGTTPPGGVCVGGIGQCPSSKTLCSGECVDLASSSEHCGQCGRSCTSWATTRGLTGGSCSQNKCLAEVETTTRATCTSQCSQRSSVCRTRYTYSLYCNGGGSGVSAGGCVEYRGPNISYCGTYPVLCDSQPPATYTPNTTQCAFRTMSCFCAEP